MTEANNAMAELYHPVTLEDLEESFERLDKEEQRALKQSAVEAKGNKYMQWLDKEMVRRASRKIYIECETMDQLLFGKAVLWAEDVRRKTTVKILNTKIDKTTQMK